MTIRKVLEDNRYQKPNFLIVGGIRHEQGSTSVGNFAFSEAIRSRPRPLVLDVTLLYVNKLSRNPGTYTSGAAIRYEGAATYVYPSNSRTVTSSDDGGAGLTRALAKTNKSRAAWGESLAEAKSTYGMIANRIRQLTAFAFALKRGDVKAMERVVGIKFDQKTKKYISATPASKRLADTHLELQFGWGPLVQDIGAAVDLYAKGITSRGVKIHRRSGNRNMGSVSDWDRVQPDLVSEGGFSGVVVNEKVHVLNELGLWNPLSLAYDLVPLSFVFDWLAQLGTFLGALTGTSGLGNLRSWRISQHRTSQYVGPGGSVASILAVNTFMRNRTPTLDLPSLDILFQGSAMSLGKTFTSLSLARQQLFK